MIEGEKIKKVNIEDQMKSAYIDYSMSVIVSRALPDVRDGFKPVHRRVLFGMLDLGVLSNRPYKKSARIVGEVLGKYHPHGDSSVYHAMVRMAQDWSLRYPLVDGQGNFGSIDGDNPAAMRYTEARFKKIAEEMVRDIDKDTVDFALNFDDSLEEPKVMPTRIPNLLINGSSGIAVGMATNIAPHNLTEVINGTIAYIEDNDITVEGLMQYIKAPDFPTGGIIYGYNGVKEAFETGRGRIVLRGKAIIEEHNGRERIIVSSIPYMVNKAEMIIKTADLVNDKKIEGISDIRDESDRNGMRIVYDLKRDAVSNVVLNSLYKYTALQSSFSVNSIALVKGRPMMLNLKDIIVEFHKHRLEVILRRTQFELRKAEKRAHILEGLIIAIENIDEIVNIIKTSSNVDEAKKKLMERFELSEIQSKAIVEMRLGSLTSLESNRLKQELDDLLKHIEYLKRILSEEDLQREIIIEELVEVKDKFGDERKTIIEYSASDFKIEDTIPDEQVVITISHLGYIKRTLLAEYKTQNRGGKGSKGSQAREEDFIEYMFSATNHNYLLLFTEQGKCFWLRVYEIPEGSKISKGRSIQNMINIPREDKVKAFINIKDLKDDEYLDNNFIILCTKNGIIKKTSLRAYSRPRQNGIHAIKIKEKDHLLAAKQTDGNSEIFLGIKSGRAIRFSESKVRPMGRVASGVIGIKMTKKKDEVIGMVCVKEEKDILVVSENGYGKRSYYDDYRLTNRGGKGVRSMNVSDKTGEMIAIADVVDGDHLMIINKSGIAIRLSVSSLRTMGRATMGVRLIKLNENDSIAAVTKITVEADDEDDIVLDEEGDVTDAVVITDGEELEPIEDEEVDSEEDNDNDNDEEIEEDEVADEE